MILLKFLGYLLISSALYLIFLIYIQRKKVSAGQIGYKGADNPNRPQVFNKLWFKIIASILAIVALIGGWLLVS